MRLADSACKARLKKRATSFYAMHAPWKRLARSPFFLNQSRGNSARELHPFCVLPRSVFAARPDALGRIWGFTICSALAFGTNRNLRAATRMVENIFPARQ